MYLHLLSDDQRRAFFKAAEHLAHCDGLDPREEALIQRARLECGMGDSQSSEVADLPTVLSSLDVAEAVSTRKAMAFELAGVLVVDRESSDQERRAFGEMATALGLEDAQAQRALDLASRWSDLTDETTTFLSEG